MWFSCFCILPGSAEAQVIWGSTVKRLLIAYVIGNICAKKYQNPLMCVKVTASQWCDAFWDTVYITVHQQEAPCWRSNPLFSVAIWPPEWQWTQQKEHMNCLIVVVLQRGTCDHKYQVLQKTLVHRVVFRFSFYTRIYVSSLTLKRHFSFKRTPRQRVFCDGRRREVVFLMRRLQPQFHLLRGSTKTDTYVDDA